MARKNGPTSDDVEFSSEYESTRSVPEFYPGRGVDDDGTMDGARFTEDDSEQESPFLRAQKRVPVRRGPIPKKTANKLKIILLAGLVAGFVAGALYAVYYYGTNSWRFRLNSSDSIQVSGNENVTRDDIFGVFGGDISKNVFKIPLEQRKQDLEQIPWVESATVMRYLPNRLAVTVKERTPVAFVQLDSRIALIDASGVVMELPQGSKYSFPVLTGFTESEPLSTRAPRVKIFLTLVRDLDSGGKNYSQDVSDVDLTDPKDIKITVAQGSVLLHASASNFLEQYEKYLAIVAQCREKVGSGKLDVDTRIYGQVPCKPIVELRAVVQDTSAVEQKTSQTEPRRVAEKPGKKSKATAKLRAAKKH